MERGFNMAKCFIVWNEEKTEGVIFRDGPAIMNRTPEQEAKWAQGKGRKRPHCVSSLGDAFRETYGEEQKCKLEIREGL